MGCLVIGVVVIVGLAMFASAFVTDPAYEDYIQYILSGLVMLTMAVVPFFIENHTKKYFETKGANLAQKEDLAELTTIVNEVKSKFETDSAILKAKLDVASGIALNLKDEERKAVVALNQGYFKWVSLLRGDFIASSVAAIDVNEDAISKAYNELLCCEASFVLFVGSTSLHGDYLTLRNASYAEYVLQRIETVGNIKGCLWSLIDSPINDDDSRHNQNCASEVVRNIQYFGAHVITVGQTIGIMELAFQKNCKDFLYANS
jgi:hypothetical protein